MYSECIPTDFYSRGTLCRGWLFLPRFREKRPIIILANDMGAVHDMSIDRYAEELAKAGFAVFIFDYRYLGESGGKARQTISVTDQLVDWHQAIEAMKLDDRVNGKWIYLIGIGLSGGHVMTIASERSDISGIIAQAPFLDGKEAQKWMDKKTIRLRTTIRIKDIISKIVTKKPYMVPIIAQPGEVAVLSVADSDSYLTQVPKNSLFRNQTPAKTIEAISSYAPHEISEQINCPSYYALCKKDTVIPIESSLKWVENFTQATFKVYNTGRFDVLDPPFFTEVIADYIHFLNSLPSK